MIKPLASTKQELPAPAGARTVVLSGLMVLSGFCGISYEILYSRLLGNMVGEHFAVSVSILLTFLLGIGCGTYYAHHLWRYLWLLEAGIGVYGVGFALGVEHFDSALNRSILEPVTQLAGSVTCCVVCLSAPAFMVGCTLPLFAGYLNRMSAGALFAKAYALYNSGACLTALLVEFGILRLFGLRIAVLSVAATNGLLAVCLVLAFRDLRQLRPDPRQSVSFLKRHLLALIVASIASATYQLTMLRVAECVLGPYHETFAMVLAVILFGQAAGSALVRKFGISFEQLMLANLFGLGVVLGCLVPASFVYAALYPMAVTHYWTSVLLKLMFLLLLMGLPALTFGATIPSLLIVQRNVARESGQLLALSSFANAAGYLLMAFVLHPLMDYGLLIVFVATLTTISLIVYLGVRNLRVAVPIVSLFGMFWICIKTWDENILYLGHTSFHSVEGLNDARADLTFPQRFKGHQDVVSINWINGSPYLFMNGYISIPLNSSSEKTVGALSAVCAPRTDSALVLGVGSGATAGTVGLLFDKTDAVEINPVLLDKLDLMSEFNFDINHMPNVTLRHDDAIHYTRCARNSYSLIINTVTTPLYFSSSKLYTRDFLQLVRRRLTPDGVYVTWVDSRIGERGIDIILKTVAAEFQHCALGCVKSSYFLLLCSDLPVAVHHPELIAKHDVLNRHFLKEHGRMARWIPYSLLTTDALTLVGDPSVPMNTLDFPALEFEMSRCRRRGIGEFKERLRQKMDVGEMAQALCRDEKFDPVTLVLRSQQQLGDSQFTEKWRELVWQCTPDFETCCAEGQLEYLALSASIQDTEDAHYEHGMQLLGLGRHHDAIKALTRALEINPLCRGCHFHIGSCYDALGQYDLAKEHYEWELFVDPAHEMAPVRLARIYLKRREYDKAMSVLDTALSLNDDERSIHQLQSSRPSQPGHPTHHGPPEAIAGRQMLHAP